MASEEIMTAKTDTIKLKLIDFCFSSSFRILHFLCLTHTGRKLGPKAPRDALLKTSFQEHFFQEFPNNFLGIANTRFQLHQFYFRYKGHQGNVNSNMTTEGGFFYSKGRIFFPSYLLGIIFRFSFLVITVARPLEK